MFIFFLFLAALLFFLIFPVWMIVHCAASKERKLISKVIWILVILVSWVLGSMAYGLFGSKRRPIQWVSASVLAVGFLGMFFFVGFLYQASRTVTAQALGAVMMMQPKELTPEDVAQLRSKVLVLHDEINNAKGFQAVYALQDAYKDMMLSQIFILMNKDGQIRTDEYNVWMRYFNERRRLDAKELGDYLRSLQ